MSEQSRHNEDIKEILSGFAKVLAVHSEKTDRALTKLTETVQELIKTGIENKKDREYDSNRMERFEKNQKEQGQKIEVISNTVLLLDERVNNSKSNWKIIGGFVMSILTAVTLAKFIS